jgi:drug/metabolite transporter (DMT)-like permease
MNLSDASILNKLAPFFSVIFSIFILKEKASWKDWIIVAAAFCGALFVVKPSFASNASFPAFIGVLGGLGAGLAYTFVRYLGKKGERNAYIVFFFSACSSLIMLPLAIMQYQPMTWAQTGWLLLAGVAASCAQLTVTAAYTYAPAKDISVYDYSQVLFTALWGAFLGQFPDWWSVLGYVIIIGSAVVKYLMSRKKH